jgi:membrane-bound metal-dependent hydrolase YbcI (DUF457 family)
MDDIVVSRHRNFMPTPVAHALAGTAVYLSASRKRRDDLWLFLAAVVAACFADLDFGLNFLTGENYHHYFTHSIVFSSLFTIGAYFFARLAHRPTPGRDAWILWMAYLTHILLDLFSKDTSAPFGLELWWPFSGEFAIAPVTVFDDIWRGTLAKLLSLHNWLAVAREAAIVAPVTLLVWLRRRRQSG